MPVPPAQPRLIEAGGDHLPIYAAVLAESSVDDRGGERCGGVGSAQALDGAAGDDAARKPGDGTPDWRVSGSQFATAHDGTGLMPLVLDREGGIPAAEAFTDGNVRGTIHRYVVWDDPLRLQVQTTGLLRCASPPWPC